MIFLPSDHGPKSRKKLHVNPVSIRFDSTNPTFINDALKIKIGIY